MKILVLAAGYGTRLYSLVKDTPKALLPIAGRPLLDYSLQRVLGLKDLREIIVVTNNKFYSQFQGWAAGKAAWGIPVTVLNDGTMTPEDRLGSVGDIDFVLRTHPVKDDLLVMGGDNIFDGALEGYFRFACQKRPSVSIGLYDVGNLEEATSFGVVALDAEGRIVSFEEKPSKPRSSLIAMCFYYFPQETLGFLGEYLRAGGTTDKAGDYIHWLVQKKGVYGFQFEGRWYDIGSVEAYQEAQQRFEDKGRG